MPSSSATMSFSGVKTSTPTTTSNKMFSAIHNIPRRMKSAGQLRVASARQKENPPPPPPRPAKASAAPKSAARPARPRPPPITLPPLPRLPLQFAGEDDPSPVSGPGSSSSQCGGVNSRGSSESRSGSSASQCRAAPDAGEKWAAQDGQIVIKVWVPSTDDIWKVRVPEEVALGEFRARVAAKVGFDVSFAAITGGRLRTVGEDGEFRAWVRKRVRRGRNELLTAHRLVLQ